MKTCQLCTMPARFIVFPLWDASFVACTRHAHFYSRGGATLKERRVAAR